MRPPRGGPRLEGGGGGRAGKGRARPRKRARAAVSSSRLPPAGSPRLRNPAGTRTQRSRRRARSAAAAPPPGTGSGFPSPPLAGLPTPSPPAQAGEQPERSGPACPPPPSHPPRPEAPPPPRHPDAHGGARRRGATTAGTAASSPELAAQPRRRPRPGLRGAEPRRGREDGGREAGAQRSPAPPPPPAAGENCACRLGEARAPLPAARARLGPRFLPSPPPVLGVLSSALIFFRPAPCLEGAPGAPRCLQHPRLAPRRPAPAPTPARVLSRLGYPAQRGLRASRSGGSLPGSERRRPPPLGRAQPQLPPAAAAAPPPGAAAAAAARPPPARRPRPQLAHPPPPPQPPPPERGGGGRREEEEREGGREKRGSERVLPRLPGRMEIGGAATRATPLPRNPRNPGSLTERVNGSAGQEHLGVRRAEERSRSSAAADAGAASRQTKPEMAKRSDG
ncbi:basic salivary proline-rich protein 2-like [Mustela erminea]|uniref:basic salivary proline-rich protein 2-like n=1 Tax=Mustela erminea TaxID=36723 RepID=UPI00138724EF|nr:basic salivary proline-rich protein 2-like [Mustela erminea]